MVQLTNHGVFLGKNWEFSEQGDMEAGRFGSMAYQILEAHNQSGDRKHLKIKFDALVSPDNNYVNILQTARASGIEKFPIPYVLSNCHHTLCAVGGTINEDDHVFGLDNAIKYGGIFVPPYGAVLHQYMREMMAGCGKMILGSDSHTRYGALGTMGIGEGGGEVAKQLLGKTYDLACPPVLAVKLTGSPRTGVGPQDVALALIAATFRNGFNKNKVLEFVGDGIANLSMEYRMGIDVMTTESAALSSVWCTDETTRSYLAEHGREEEYYRMQPQVGAYYDGLIEIDLSKVECMIALPFHPSNAVPIREFKANAAKMLAEVEAEGRRIEGKKGGNTKPFSVMQHLHEDGEVYVDQALISGCSGGLFENVVAVADILKGHSIRADKLKLGVNPASLPVMTDLMNQGIAQELAICGVTLRPAICGPCFGVTDAPANDQLSIRHMTRNYPNREGSKPGQGQMAAACLMDARSIAATVRNGGRLTAADELTDVVYREAHHHFDSSIYANQVFDNYNRADTSHELTMGPNIADWPEMSPLKDHLLLKVVGSYRGSVTTDELIPSGEASSFRSNPEKISQYTMISRDPGYVARAKAVRELEKRKQEKGLSCGDETVNGILMNIVLRHRCEVKDVTFGSVMVSDQIGDGSSREQAASCQKVLGGFANLANEYSTKRYRSNLINWGILPLRTEELLNIGVGCYLFLPDVKATIKSGQSELAVQLLNENGEHIGTIPCTLDALTDEERCILISGSLINYYRSN